MAKIIDPDGLTRSTSLLQLGVDGNIWIDTPTLSISLDTFETLTTDGVTLQAFYSYLKEEWKTDAALIKFPFPMVAITPEQFEFVDGWMPANVVTQNYFKDGGYAIKNVNGTSAEEYSGIITLGTIGITDQAYIQQVLDGESTNIVLTGVVNQCVKVYGDGGGHGIDNASASNYRSYFKIFVREYQKIYAQSQLGDIGVSSFTYQAYRFPLSNGTDLKITHDDTTVSTTTPYTAMTITYYAAPVQRTIGAGTYDFDVVVDAGIAGDATAEQIYEFVQHELRQATDIDDGTGVVTGKTADSLLRFVGDTLVTSTGVFIEDFSSVDINRIEFYDVTGTKRVFPFVAAGTIYFNDNLSNDTGPVYRMFFTNVNGKNFGDADAVIVQDANLTDIAGIVPAGALGSSVSFTFDYDGNVQGGRTAGTDAPVTVVAIGLDRAQYVKAIGTIGRTNANTVTLTAALERNYSNVA